MSDRAKIYQKSYRIRRLNAVRMIDALRAEIARLDRVHLGLASCGEWPKSQPLIRKDKAA